ncbi:MAG TPA: HEAT repeat domain-containing protein [Longimicrobium sp.]|nr:HEAT repeat domain-containing protein [Longimicrobium sp.]
MTRWTLLEAALWIEAIALAGALALLFGHAVRMRVQRRRYADRLERARRAFYSAVRSGRPSRGELADLRGLPPRQRKRLFLELLPSLAGSTRAQLGVLAQEVGLREMAERMTESRRWWRRLHGLRLLGVMGAAGPVLPRMLRDRHRDVRAEAVEAASAHATPEIIEGLIALLDEPGPHHPFLLRDTLIRIGPPVVEPLARYLSGHVGQDTYAALEVAAGLPAPPFAAPALRLCRDPLAGARARAATLAGALGGEESVGVLQYLLHDGDAEVRAAAAGALCRLGHWPSAPAIAALLRDPAWAVRRAAALALRALGSPGQLYLRGALRSEDRFAADMARQTLEMPDWLAESA